MGSISSVSLRGVQNISACRSEQVKLHQESNRWEQWIVQLKKNHFDLFIISRLLVRKKKKTQSPKHNKTIFTATRRKIKKHSKRRCGRIGTEFWMKHDIWNGDCEGVGLRSYKNVLTWFFFIRGAFKHNYII